jgi:hypothetical protein
MEMSQGNSLCSYLKPKKCHLFSFIKSGNRRAEQVCLGSWYQWEVEDEGKGYGMVKIVQILCAHVCKWKNDTC